MAEPSSSGLEPADNPLWQYSLSLYAEPVVEQCCLEWQNRHGANVNLVLFCCWSAVHGVALGKASLVELKQLVAGWERDVVQPLRRLRQAMKTVSGVSVSGESVEQVRQRIFEAELLAERLAQDRLYQWWRELPPADGVDNSAALAGNLNGYLQALGCDTVDVAHSLVRTVISGKMQHLQET